jgi:transposase
MPLNPRRKLHWIRQASIPGVTGECIIVTSHSCGNGYPQLRRNNKCLKFSRIVSERRHGATELDVLHLCDEKRCINPDHFIPGTHRENMRQAAERGQLRRGDRSPRAKLTEEQALEVINSTESCGQIAKRFGLGVSSINLIKRGVNWKHLPRVNKYHPWSNCLAAERVASIKAMLKSGATVSETARKFGIDYEKVRNIATGRTFKD